MGQLQIRVLNPLTGESGFKTEKQAAKLVRRGHAERAAPDAILYTSAYIEMRLRQREAGMAGLSLTGAYRPTQCGYRSVGGPSTKTMQLDVRAGRYL